MKLVEMMNRMFRDFSMYRGVSFGLTGIWLAAFVLAFIGQLGFSPWALLVSTLVLVGSTYVTSVLCGLLFGVRVHAESSFITGLILSFLFLPSIEVSQLAILAFVGMIAGASKFLIVWRGRHIFNPAAFAAVIIGLTGLGAAAWWVATPILTPVVLLVMAILLYQTKRTFLAGVFLAITAPVLVITFLAFGANVWESLVLLLSWPLLFLAGFMLTEPLTLPPRKWQMYIVSAVVAVAFLLPFEIGPLTMSPALALLLGNIVAAFFAVRHAITLTFKERNVLTPTTDELVFTTTTPFTYEAGQYAELWLPQIKYEFRGFRRNFSLTSSPTDDLITFGVKFYSPSSSFKQALRTLETGAPVSVTNVSGDFVLPRQTERPLLFVAGGIGITPFISHLRWLKAKGEARDIVLIYTVGNTEEVAYKDVLIQLGIRIIIVAPHKPTDIPKEWRYVEGTRIDYGALKLLVPDITERWAYASGPTPFVQVAKHELRKIGVQGVKTDYFAGY